MQTYSKSHERDENRKINQGFWNSVFGLLFCWLPGLGLLLALMGFFREMVRLTCLHRVKRVLCTLFSTLVLIACVGALVGEAYLYINNPNIIHETATKGWTALTGQKTLPWETDGYYEYADYDDTLGSGEDEYDLPEDEYYTGDDDTGLDTGDEYDADFDDGELESFPEDDGEEPQVDLGLLEEMRKRRGSGLSGL